MSLFLPNGCRIVHGTGATIRRPFDDVPLVMHEMDGGRNDVDDPGFRGQFGFIAFDPEIRLPRHVHVSVDGALLPERIMVFAGAGLVELNGALTVIPPGSMVDIAAGVPHTWTSCPPDLVLPDGSRTDGTFLMVYVYAAPTSFFPVLSTQTRSDVSGLPRYDGDVENLRIPRLTAPALRGRASLAWNTELRPL